ncbi:uncharacterized protein LOC9628977 [Selaginella moellendorffii]|uniref:uncharacterized protein LOC9628977 n=1 Tax=Selaginella moellendorffii TaxID=88036 RepID=UPI000D1C7B6C|nr:uncharacterized protein LOC9628977 [Selaginella moellendorffii]|eukprot:XP_024519361.1 uncharacterized protein LOC9628977 [Selaginella moellendorffii]
MNGALWKGIRVITHQEVSPNLSTPRHAKLGFVTPGPGSFAKLAMAATTVARRPTVCIGDVHGHLIRLRALWRNLEAGLGALFASATVIFLGDYCDRGPDTAGVLDFLVALPASYPSQKHVFLCGNHDFGMSAFLGLLPAVPGFPFSRTWEGTKGAEEKQEAEGWWSGRGFEDMHLQGRRWGGRVKAKFNVKKNMEYRGSIFDSEPTFSSYGVEHGDREGLLGAVPEDHKAFLRKLVWIYEQDGSESCGKLVAVHAGLEAARPLEEQLRVLREKDVRLSRHENMLGRSNVWNAPEELVKDGVMVVSGHHGSLHMESHRLIIDESGGQDNMPLAAVVLPGRQIVRDTDSIGHVLDGLAQSPLSLQASAD